MRLFIWVNPSACFTNEYRTFGADGSNFSGPGFRIGRIISNGGYLRAWESSSTGTVS